MVITKHSMGSVVHTHTQCQCIKQIKDLYMMKLNTVHVKPLHTIKKLIFSSRWNLSS